MKDKYYSIGEVSKITGISKDTLHFYSKEGLLIPDCINLENKYRYYSRQNLWQLDIISVCRKLDVPLKQIKTILEYKDNGKIAELLMEYQKEAIRRRDYYEQVVKDISWYYEEANRIETVDISCPIKKIKLEEKLVILGSNVSDELQYHTYLQKVIAEEMRESQSIQRKYGYIVDVEEYKKGNVKKEHEYLIADHLKKSSIDKSHLYVIPSGEYAVYQIRIKNEKIVPDTLLDWMKGNGYGIEKIFMEETGLQLYEYLEDYVCTVKVLLRKKNNRLTV